MDDVSLFADSSFLFLAALNLYYIDILYQFKNKFVKKKNCNS